MNDKLDNLRRQIDVFDEKLLLILARRIHIVREIGEIKKEHGVKPLDGKRWQGVLRSKLSKAHSLNLSEKFIEKLYNLIHEYSLEIESDKK